jgi:hypothetical protein
MFTFVLAFLLGIYAHSVGLFRDIRSDIGLDDQNLTFIKNLVREPKFALNSILHAQLPTLYIDMQFDHLQKIEAKRQEALGTGILVTSDNDFVPATIRMGENTIRVDMRLKGDLTDHFETDKWSYRIHVKDDDELFGMRRFSIQHPGTRKYLFEWGWLENLRQEGVLAPRYQFVNVVFNGTPMGIYALEEHFSYEMLEAQDRREGVIVNFDESVYWQRYAQLGYSPGYFDFVMRVKDYRNAFIDTSRPTRVDKNIVLKKEQEAAVGLLRAFQEGKLSASEVFDVSRLARFMAVNELWQTYHGQYWNNMHFYYNPLTAKLEPIGFDGTADIDDAAIALYAFSEPWLIQALEDPILAEAYVTELLRVSQPEYLEQLKSRLEAPITQYQISFYREFPFVRSISIWNYLSNRQGYIRRSLEPTKLLVAYASFTSPVSDTKEETRVQVEIRNLLSLPVEIIAFQVGDQELPLELDWLESEDGYFLGNGKPSIILAAEEQGSDIPMRYTTFRIPVNEIASAGQELPEVKIISKILGSDAKHEDLVNWYPKTLTSNPLPVAPTIEQAIEKYPFLKPGMGENVLVVHPGEWIIEGDLILPADIRLQAGPATKLFFSPGSIMVATGTLEFHGTPEEPVVLAPLAESWGGLVVIGAEEPSVWENVIVRDTTGIERGGWILTGGITFYESPIYMKNSRILGSSAEDGINIVRSAFEFSSSEFGGFASDAFDGDFVEGVIYSCTFHETKGDAVDVSGSIVQINKVKMINIGDKGLSVGEDSRVHAQDIQIKQAGIGVASKDLSEVVIKDASIEDALFAGMAAYTKKKEYGPASIVATNVEFDNVKQELLVQTNSWIELNGKRIEGTELDVDALYEAGILGN